MSALTLTTLIARLEAIPTVNVPASGDCEAVIRCGAQVRAIMFDRAVALAAIKLLREDRRKMLFALRFLDKAICAVRKYFSLEMLDRIPVPDRADLESALVAARQVSVTGKVDDEVVLEGYPESR